ncbi:MAG: DUF3352 domain-containing protein [Candidatus Aminicenantes bacterium]
MRKTTIFSLILLLGVIGFLACGKKTETPKAGSASADDMLGLLPMNAKGVFLVNVHQAMAIEAADKAIRESDDYQKYQEFIEKTGIDPQKDIFYVAAALTSDIGGKEEAGVAVVNMKYDRETILPLIKEKLAEEEQEMVESDYSGMTLYSVQGDEEQEGAFAFLDESNVVVGSENEVKTVIDISQKKADNIYKNQALTDLLAKTEKEGILWGAFLIPEKAVEEAASENPMMSSFQAVRAATLLFDYKNQNIMAEIKLMSTDEENNKKIADALNGFKALGGMAAGEKPEIGELLNKIEISSTPDHVKVYCSLPEELLNKLKSSIPQDED